VYAVKKIKLEEEHVLRFRKDYIFLKELNHPSICTYKGLYFEENERLAYLVMEHLPFPSLAEYTIKSE
jgi:serine/threonine protein kinase